jgi:cob(I)alamin adenosyltransferase
VVILSKIYTKTGDNGETSLADGNRVAKFDAVIDAIGVVDEANSAIGMIQPYNDIVQMIQNDLFDIGADLAKSDLNIDEERVLWLESVIDDMNEYLEPLRSFILPTGPIHNARAVVRRAERIVWLLSAISDGKDNPYINPVIPKYLNRLSDLLFVMARYNNKDNEVLWTPKSAAGERQNA